MYNFLFLKKSVFLIIISIYIIAITFSNSELNLNNQTFSNTLNGIKIVLIFLLFFLKYSNLKIGKFEFTLIFLAIVLGLSLDPYLITISFFILASISISLIFRFGEDIIYKSVSLNLLISICLIFLLYYLGYLDGMILYDSSEYAIGNKESYGFSHPNKASLLIVQSILISLCFRNKSILFISILLYIYTFFDFGGRTALGGLLVFSIVYITRFVPGSKKIIRYSIIFLHLIFPFLLVFLISKDMWHIGNIDLNYITSTRLSLMRTLYIENGGIHFYPISITGKIVDVGIVNFLVGMGWIIYYAYIYMMNSYLKEEYDFNYFAMAISILCMNFMENFLNANMLAAVIVFSRYIFIRNNNYEKDYNR